MSYLEKYLPKSEPENTPGPAAKPSDVSYLEKYLPKSEAAPAAPQGPYLEEQARQVEQQAYENSRPAGGGMAGLAGDVVRGAVSGVVRGLGGLARAVQWVAPDQTPLDNVLQQAAGWTDERLARNADLFAESKRSVEGRESSPWNVRGWLYPGLESLGMLAPGVATTVVTGNPVAGAAVTGAQFWGDTAQQSYDQAQGLDESERVAYANWKGAAEGGTEALLSFIPFKIARALPKALQGKLIAKAAGASGKAPLEIGKDIVKTIAAEVPVEMGQEYLGQSADYAYEQRPDMPGFDDLAPVIGPTIIMSGLLGTGAAIQANGQRRAIHDALTNPDVPVEVRLRAVDMVGQELRGRDAEMAQLWMSMAVPQAQRGPVAIDLIQGAADKKQPPAAEVATPAPAVRGMAPKDPRVEATELANRLWKQTAPPSKPAGTLERAAAKAAPVARAATVAPAGGMTMSAATAPLLDIQPEVGQRGVDGGLSEVRQEAGGAQEVPPVRGEDVEDYEAARRQADAELFSVMKAAGYTMGEDMTDEGMDFLIQLGQGQDLAWPVAGKPEEYAPMLNAVRQELQRNRLDGVPPDKTPLDAQAHDAASSPENERPEPTPAQIEAGNYKKGHVKLHGLDISIENPAGSVRKGVDETGRAWETRLNQHYGYIRGTVGPDKDHVDVFVKPGIDETTAGDMVVVIDQKNLKTGQFDEPKVMIGYNAKDWAKEAYLANYDAGGSQRIQGISVASVAEFKHWLAQGDTRKPFAKFREKLNQELQRQVEQIVKPGDKVKIDVGLPMEVVRIFPLPEQGEGVYRLEVAIPDAPKAKNGNFPKSDIRHYDAIIKDGRLVAESDEVYDDNEEPISDLFTVPVQVQGAASVSAAEGHEGEPGAMDAGAGADTARIDKSIEVWRGRLRKSENVLAMLRRNFKGESHIAEAIEAAEKSAQDAQAKLAELEQKKQGVVTEGVDEVEAPAAKPNFLALQRQAKAQGATISKKQPDGSYVVTGKDGGEFRAGSLAEVADHLAEGGKMVDQAPDAGEVVSAGAVPTPGIDRLTPNPVRVMDVYGRFHYVDKGELAGQKTLLRRYNAKGERLPDEKSAIHRGNLVDETDAEAVAVAKRARRFNALEKKAEKNRLSDAELAEAKGLQKQVVADFEKRMAPKESAEPTVKESLTVAEVEGEAKAVTDGLVFHEFRHDAKGAIEKLREVRAGEAIAALHHVAVGDIDLVWGAEGTGKSDGYGLAKILKFHPEVVDDLQAVLDSMRVSSRSKNRVQLESDKHKATVRLEWDGKSKQWLLTAFEKRVGTETRTDTSGVSRADDTARRTTDPDITIAGSGADVKAEPVSPVAQEQTPEPVKSKPEAANTVFTEDAYQKARAVMKAKLSQLNAGIDPELMQAGFTIAGYHIEKGSRKFVDYAAAMIEDFGEAIKPYLKAFYNGVRDLPGIDQITREMDSYPSVAGYDVEKMDSSGESDIIVNEEDKIPKIQEESDGKSAGVGAESPEALGGTSAGADQGAEGGGSVRGGKSGRGKTDQGRNGRSANAGVSGARSRRGGAAAVHSAETGDLTLAPAEAPGNLPEVNFAITDEVKLGQGSEGVKFADNLAAIRALKEIEREGRRATAQEQRLLARYVGWGGLSNAFADDRGAFKPGWESRGQELAELLTDAELKAARRSTRNAHYTSEAIVRGMWQAAQAMGFTRGMVLEPSAGTGNFLGLAPADLEGRFVAVEYDSLTARIAGALYPQSTVLHSGFQKLALPDNAFDLAIGNPPFGAESLQFQHKPHLNRHSIHNQFFLGSLEALKPGGLQAMVVSRYLLDAKDSGARMELAGQAKLLGAVRLPDTAFKENARTEVVTDILFLQKFTEVEAAEANKAIGWLKKTPSPKELHDMGEEARREYGRLTTKYGTLLNWTETTTIPDPLGGEAMTVNSYFARHPEMIIGTLERSGSMRHGADVTVRLEKGADFEVELERRLERLPKAVMPAPTALEAIEKRYLELSDSLRIALEGLEHGSIVFDRDGRLSEVIERETPEGGYEFAKRELSPTAPWSDRLIMGADGRWYTLDDALDEKGNKVKQIGAGGKATRLNAKVRNVFESEEQIPDSMRLGASRFERLVELIKLRDLLKKQLVLETSDAPKMAMESNRRKLNTRYDAFVAKHDFLNSPKNEGLISDMPDGALIVALELGYRPALSATKAKQLGEAPRPADAQKAPILTERVVIPYEPPSKAESAADALVISMAESGRVDLERLAALLDTDQAGVVAALHEQPQTPLIFHDPELNTWQSRDQYLSGQVKRKLAAARGAGLEKNVAALEKVQPEPWSADQVTAVMGATWIPTDVYEGFIEHLTGEKGRVSFSRVTNAFDLHVPNTAKGKDWGTEDAGLDYLLKQMLNSQSIRLTYKDSEGKTHFMPEATALAQVKADQIAVEFGDWVFAEGDRRRRLVEIFNEKFNVRVQRQYDGQHLFLPGKVPDQIIQMRRHQKNAIWRGIQERYLLLDHVVGAGKTFTAIARAVERRRMGLSRKPMIVVPNHMVGQFAADVYRLYPGAKLLAAGKKDFDSKNRRRLFAKIATGDWDVVIVPHSSFKFISISPEAEERYLEEEIRIAKEAIKEAEEEAAEQGLDNGWRKPFNVKQAEALAEKLENKMAKLKAKTADRLLTFEQLGVDDMIIDEAHEFKNLFYSSRMTGVRGMGDRAGSEKAYDLYQKVRVLRDSPTGSVVFMTGTPISNSAVEMYTMMRYLAGDELRELGLEHFDAWRAQYVEAATAWEPTESGRLKEVTRLGRSWSNMRSLMDLYYSFTDAVPLDDIKTWYAEDNAGRPFPVPQVKGGERTKVVVPPTAAQTEQLTEILAGFDGLEGIQNPNERNAARLRLMDRARKVSLDARAVEPSLPTKEAGGKLEAVSREVKRLYSQWAADKGTQLVFLDRSVPKSKGDDKLLKDFDKAVAERDGALARGDERGYMAAVERLERFDENEVTELRRAQAGGWNAYQQIKENLVSLGLPAKEIRFVQEASTDEQKQALFDAVNAGEVRVLIGSTPRMGAGTNVQQRLVGLHHVDVTWKPSDIEQREGRIIRQGNRLLEKYGIDKFEVEVLAYATERTVDAKMWDLNATKLRTINGIRKYSGEFTMDFEDEESVGMAEIAALASGDPLLLERVKLDSEISRLEILRRGYNRQVMALRDRVDDAEKEIRTLPAVIERRKAAAEVLSQAKREVEARAKGRRLSVEGKDYNSQFAAHQAIETVVKAQQDGDEKARFAVEVGGEKLTSKAAIERALETLGDVNPFEVTLEGDVLIGRSPAARVLTKRANDLVGQMLDAGSDIKTVRVGEFLGYGLDLDVETSWGGSVRAALSLVDGRGSSVETVTGSASEVKKGERPGLSPQNIRKLLDNFVETVNQAASEVAYRYPQGKLDAAEKALPELKKQLDAKGEFPQQLELKQKRDRLEEVVGILAAKGGGAREDGKEGAEAPKFSLAFDGHVAPVHVEMLSGENIWRQANEHYRENFQGKDVVNPRIGTVAFGKEGRSKFLSVGRSDARRMSVATVLDEVVAEAVPYVEEPDAKGRPGISVVRAVSAVEVGGKVFAVDLVLRRVEGDGDKFYTLAGYELKDLDAIDRGDVVEASLPIRGSSRSVKVSIAQLLEAVKGQPVFARGGSGVVALGDVEFDAIFERVTVGMENRDGFVVVPTAAALPASILAEIEKQGNRPDQIDGVFHSGKVYLVRENIASAARLEEVLFHEWHGHAGLYAMFGNDGRQLKTEMAKLYDLVGAKRLFPLGRRHGINLMPYGHALAKAGYNLETRKAIMMEEMLAHLTKEYSRGPLAKRIREVLGQIRAWLRDHGFAALSQWGESDIAWLLKRARAYAEAGAWVKGNAPVAINGEEILARLREAGIPDEMLRQLVGAPKFAGDTGEGGVELGAEEVKFSIRDKAQAAGELVKNLTPDNAGLLFQTFSGMLPERMKAAIGSVLSNPHYGSQKSKHRAAAYALALERGANANEIKHEVMAREGNYEGLEGLREFYRQASADEKAMIDKLLVEGDILHTEFTEADLASASNPLGRVVPEVVRRGYFAFRQTIAKSTATMFDRLGRLRLLPHEDTAYYQELIDLLDEGLTPDEVVRRFGIHQQAVDAYLQIRQGRAKLDAATRPYRDMGWYSTLRDALLKGLNGIEMQQQFSKAPELLEAFRAVRKDYAGEFVTAEKFKKAQWYKTLADLLTVGDDHPMLQKLELYNAYRGVQEYDSQLAKLKEQWRTAKGYLPRLRKDGEQHVKVFQVEEDGTFTEVWMQPAKTVFGAGQLRDKVAANLKEYLPHSFDPEAQYEVVVEPNTATPEEIFLGIGSHRAIEALLGKVFDKAVDAGVIENQLAVQQQVLRILADEISARGFGRHRLARAEHLIEGYETENTPAILSQFVGSMAGWLSKSEFAMRANKVVSQIPATRPEDKVWVREYVDDALKNSSYVDQWFGSARSFAALMYLGFKASSALLNATQNYVWGQAKLSSYTKGATGKLLRAQHDVVKDRLLVKAGKAGILSEEESWVLEEGLRRGRTHANYVRAMSGLDDNGGVLGKGQAGLRWLTDKAMAPFQLVEVYWNREPALLAAYRVFREQGQSKEAALKQAEKFVDDVHFVVGKENIPGLLRKMGPVGRTLYTFQSYTHNYLLGMLTSLSKGEFAVVARSLTALVLFGGLAALPFGDDLDKWYRRIFGERPLRMLERWLRETAGEYADFGDQVADFVLHGAPALAGVNFSNAIGVNVAWFSPEDETLAERVVGVWGGLAQKVRLAGVAAAKGDGYRVVESLSPEALANILRAYRHYADGTTTLSGRPVFGDDGKQVRYTVGEGLIRAFGFMPLGPSKQTQSRWDARRAKDYWSERKADVLARFRAAKDRKEAMQLVRDFNRELRRAPGGVLVPPITLQSLRQSLMAKPDKRELAYHNR